MEILKKFNIREHFNAEIYRLYYIFEIFLEDLHSDLFDDFEIFPEFFFKSNNINWRDRL